MKLSSEEITAHNKRFFEVADNVLVKAKAVSESRSVGYNTNMRISDYFPDGPRDLLYECQKKINRIRNLIMLEEQGRPLPEGEGGLEDSVEDLINYARYIPAYRFMEDLERGCLKEEEQWAAIEPVTEISVKDIRESPEMEGLTASDLEGMARYRAEQTSDGV